MAESITVALFVGSMAIMAIYTYYVLRPASKIPCAKVIFPVGQDTPVDILVTRALQTYAGLPDCNDYEFVVLDLGTDQETRRRIELLLRDHPFLQVVEPEELEKILCNPHPGELYYQQ